MKRLFILCAAIGLSGCGSMSQTFANRISCTADGQRAIVASMYGPLGVASLVDAADAAVLCRKPAP
jgi:hypothetical protein